MAYIPPHKRHSLDKGRPSPCPELLAPLFKRNMSLRSQVSNIDRSGKIVFAEHALYRWFAVGSIDNELFPSTIHLERVTLESIEGRPGEKPLILVNGHVSEENSEQGEDDLRSPSVIIADNVKQDLVSSFERLKNEMYHQSLEHVKPTLIARFGKILFRGSPSVRLESVQKDHFGETILRQLRRYFYANVPSSYMENIIDVVVPKIGVDFVDEKDIYHVQLSDNTRPDSTVSCKCSLKADKKLQLYKVELNPVRQMVMDISCLSKNLDLRLILCTKRILTAISDDEMNRIRDLINSAVMDSDMKGGLRWPLGKESSGNRYRVIRVWHTITKSYRSPSLRLKVRHADRFDFSSGTGEAAGEVSLNLKGILSELQEKGAESDAISTMLKNSLRLIWHHFLCCERFLT